MKIREGMYIIYHKAGQLSEISWMYMCTIGIKLQSDRCYFSPLIFYHIYFRQINFPLTYRQFENSGSIK